MAAGLQALRPMRRRADELNVRAMLFHRKRLLLAAALAFQAACQAEHGPALPYALTARPVLPFPTDEATAPDPSTPTGQRLRVGPKGTNLGDLDEAIFLFGEDFAASLNRLDGWSTLGPAFVPLSTDPDVRSAEGRVLVLDLDRGARVETTLRALGGETEYGRQTRWIAARPRLPLAPATRHALVVTRGLATEAGERFSRPAVFDALWEGGDAEGEPARVGRARERLRTLRAALGAFAIDPDDVLVAELFTTMSIAEESEALVEAYASAPDPAISLDTDGDGAPDVYAGPAADPRWRVPRDEDLSAVGASVRFAFEMPNFREGMTGPMAVDARQATLQGYERVEGVLTLPKGSGPFPVVVYQHGIGSEKESLYRFANGLAEAGTAALAIDLPLHGSRTDRPGNASTLFINIVDPALVLDNFRQAETERSYLVRVIDALARADLFGDGTRRLDRGRIFYLGTSLGSMVGAVAVGLEPRYEGAVLMVGGGTMLEFFDRFLGGFALNAFPVEVFVSVAQSVFDRGDPTNYAGRSTDKQILLMQAMQDEAVPAGATASLARAMRLPIVGAAHAPEPDLPVLPPPVERRGWTQWAPARHNLTWDPSHSAETYARSRGQLFRFIERWAATGVGVIE